MVAPPVEATEKPVNGEKDQETTKPIAELFDPCNNSKEIVEPQASNSVDMGSAENKEKLEVAAEKLSAGKKALAQSLFQQAVDLLADACSCQSSVVGDLSYRMCEFYYYYGKALLELARIEDDVLGNALAGVPEGEDMENSQVENPENLTEEERDKVAEQVDEALEEVYEKIEGGKAVEKGNDADSKEESTSEEVENEGRDADNKEETDLDKVKGEKDAEDTKVEKNTAVEEKMEVEDKETSVDEVAEGEGEIEGEEGEEEAQEGEIAESSEDQNGESTDDGQTDEADDVSNLQLAWEVLELARTIYDKRENKSEDDRLKLSQVLLRLGEIALENSNYPDSIIMYSDCLKIQQSILSADDRWLAETHYQLGIAHSLADNFDEAVLNLQAAISVIEKRIENLRSNLKRDNIEVTDDMDTASLSSEKQTWVTDILELEKLLPELQEKVNDIKESKASFTEKLKALKAQFQGQLSGSCNGKSGFEDNISGVKDAKPIDTSLIRKKRKTESEVAGSEQSNKKPRTEDCDPLTQTQGVTEVQE